MNDQTEKQKLWKVYGILMGVMVGGAVLILGVQSAWNAIQQNLAKSNSPSNSTTQSSLEKPVAISNSSTTSQTPNSSPTTNSQTSQSLPQPIVSPEKPSEVLPTGRSDSRLYRIVNVESNDVLYILSGPSANNPKNQTIGSIPSNGTDISIIGDRVKAEDGGVWAPINYQGTRGWVNSYYLTEQFKTSGREQYSVVSVESNDVLYILSGPGVEHDIVGRIPYNATNVQITGEGVTVENGAIWVPVRYRGIMGWVNSRYLAKQ